MSFLVMLFLHDNCWTLPIFPLSNSTLIPWGWTWLEVRILFTLPSVNFPVRWSCFWTIWTIMPMDILFLGGISFNNILNFIDVLNLYGVSFFRKMHHQQFYNLRKDNANDTEDSGVVSNLFSFVPWFKFYLLLLLYFQD